MPRPAPDSVQPGHTQNPQNDKDFRRLALLATQILLNPRLRRRQPAGAGCRSRRGCDCAASASLPSSWPARSDRKTVDGAVKMPGWPETLPAHDLVPVLRRMRG